MLESVRARMSTQSSLHVVEGGDHSLLASKTELKARGFAQDDVDLGIGAAIEAFLAQR
jgi:hypothetical protein